MRSAVLRFCAILCLLVLIPFVPSVLAEEGESPSLYYNETAWEGSASAIDYDGEYFIPIDIFSAVPYIKLDINTSRSTFVIRNTMNGAEISALCMLNTALYNRVLVNMTVHTVEIDDNSYFYVNAEYICGAMGMKFSAETLKSGRCVARIADDSALLDFPRFLACTVPDEYGGEFPLPEVKARPKQSIKVAFRGINEHTDRVISELRRAGTSACFFLTKDELRENKATVAKIIASGLQVGLVVDSYGDTESANAANALLYEIAVTKSHYLMLSANDPVRTIDTGSGYIGCTPTLEMTGFPDVYSYINASAVVPDAVILLPQSEATLDFVEYISDMGYFISSFSISE